MPVPLRPDEILDAIDLKLLDKQINTVFRVAGRKELSNRQKEHMEGVAELLTELYNAIVCEGQ